MKSTITVLMSSYNGEKYIIPQIESILSQVDCNVNLIVRDDGSTDNTRKILSEYAKAKKLTFWQGHNMGPAKSFLMMIKEAPMSEYYAFADQDDIWFPTKLIKGIEVIHSYDVPALYTSNMRYVDSETEIIAEKGLPDNVATDFKSVMTVSGKLFGCTMIFNRKMVEFIKANELPEYLIMHDLWLAMIASMYGTLVYDKNVYMDYRRHCESVTFNRDISLIQKVKGMIWGDNNHVSQQCEEFVNNVGAELIRKLGQWEICDILLNYRQNIFKKIKLEILMMSKHDMSIKQKVYFFVQILCNKY